MPHSWAEIVALALVNLVALQHVGFLVLEMFLVRQPIGMKVFALSAERAEVLAPALMNQGLYNGFLAAGLYWALFQPDPRFAFQLLLFFLGCVVLAGVFGAFTVSRAILVVQALPAAAALGAVWWAYSHVGLHAVG
jgi:putative membrane protein